MFEMPSNVLAANEQIPLDQLNVDTSYQRALSLGKVKGIAQDWNETAAGSLIVNLRESGEYYVMDGQHRLAAMRVLQMPTARCDVHYNLTIQQEAKAYNYCNTHRKNPDRLNGLKSRLVWGDPIAQGLVDTIQKAGWKVDFTEGGSKQKDAFQAIGAAEKIFLIDEGKQLEYVIRLLIESWPEAPEITSQIFLEALSKFHDTYNGVYDRKKFVEAMKLSSPKLLIQKAQLYAESNSRSRYIGLFQALVERYNHSRRINKLILNLDFQVKR